MMPDEGCCTAQIRRPAGLETVQPVLLYWGFRCRPQTPPPEASPWTRSHGALALTLRALSEDGKESVQWCYIRDLISNSNSIYDPSIRF